MAIVAAVGVLLINLVMPVNGVTQAVRSQDLVVVPDRFRGEIVRQVPLSNANQAIALTFDDGPSEDITPQVLSILKDKQIQATFFVLGQNLKKYPEIGQQILTDGHTLGNHTWHHWHLRMREFIIAREIESTAKLIYQVTGVRTNLFRPPYGHRYNGLVDYARKR
ncbi:MAG: polysaccharide deacetylase family protein, partial [Symploca sp. SIO2E6]|nr:polysaccharide deacetylase family protein [Symploca sp. SIO2E6]